MSESEDGDAALDASLIHAWKGIPLTASPWK